MYHINRDDLERMVRERTTELRTHQVELETQNEELRTAQQALEASRRSYIELYELAPVAYFTFDVNGVIQDVNLTGSNLLGTAKPNLIKKPFNLYIFSPEDKVHFIAHKKETFLTQERRECMLRLRRSDGAVFHARLQSTAVENVDGRAGHIRTAVTDISRLKEAEDALKRANEKLEEHVQARTSQLAKTITALTTEISERKRAEKALSESQEFLRKAQEIARIGSWSFDLRSRQVVWSRELFRLFGIAPGGDSDHLKHIIPRIVHPDDRRKIRKSYRQLVKTSEADA